MADGDGAAIDIEPLLRNAEPVAAIEHLAGERLVEFPQIDVVHLQAVALEQLRHGEDRADAHLVGLAAGDGKAAERAERLQGRVFSASLASITTQAEAPSDNWLALPAVMNLPLAHRLERGEAFERGVGPVAFVARERDLLEALGIGVLVDDFLRRRQRHDLARRSAWPAARVAVRRWLSSAYSSCASRLIL